MKNRHIWLGHFFNFLAVILGVYLAFYMNERAEESDDRNESLLLMSALVKDLSEDIETYETYQIPENERHQQNVVDLLNALSADSAQSTAEQVAAIFQVENFAPTTSTYSSMKSSGKLQLIADMKLRKKLTEYYEGLVPESEEKGGFQADYFTGELLTWLTRNVDLSQMTFMEDGERTVFQNKLIIYEALIDQKVKSYQMLVEDSRALQQQIEAVIASE